ncbi:lasso peptide biosynthesis B2 protein [Caulobacter sp. CCNWLY153]|uniref:lasso peptide biosynthesis B2 protein n=1 Tax=unclassified Caulobacter TaxID=2648921 RepID=UPI002FF1A4D1
MRFSLAPDVYAARVVDDLVFLTIAADTYFCLVDGARHLTLGPNGAVEAQAEAARDLIAAGLIVEGPTSPRAPLPPPIAAELPIARVRPSLVCLVTAVRANLHAARAVKALSMSQLVALAGPRAQAPTKPPEARLIEASQRFQQLAPWLPREGVCLMRSLQQKLFLATQGLTVNWVFGVRTWPFEAHCWLQAGDVVLDDTVEHAGGFTPLFAV